jgi:nicotinamidase-related amidase
MNTPTKTIDPARTAVLLIEFQKEWLESDGKINGLMEDRPQFQSAIEGGRELLAYAREKGLMVIHSGLRFATGHPELGENGLGLRGAIKKFGTFPADGKGSEWGKGFVPIAGEFVPTGRAGGSAFAGSNLNAFLSNNRIDTLLIAGFALHVCVESTLRAGHDLGYDCLVVTDATAAFTATQREHVFSEVVRHYGECASLDQIRAQLG